jgi:hypothetical protein
MRHHTPGSRPPHHSESSGAGDTRPEAFTDDLNLLHKEVQAAIEAGVELSPEELHLLGPLLTTLRELLADSPES